MSNQQILIDDEHGLDLLVMERHNVNFVPSDLSLGFEPTHTDRDGSPMVVLFHHTLRQYYVAVTR